MMIKRIFHGLTPLLVFGSLLGCAHRSDLHAPVASTTPSIPAEVPVSPPSVFDGFVAWPLPGKLPTQYALTEHDGRVCVKATADASASMFRHRESLAVSQINRVRFSWWVPELIRDADLTQRGLEDSPVRVVLAFDGDRSTFSMKNQMLSELARALTGEPMPYATLMYVWSNQSPVETIIPGGRTDRIRKVVVERGDAGLKRWLDYERDVSADFQRAFGEPPGNLIGMAFMTDTDNTHSKAEAWYGPLVLLPSVQADVKK